MQNKEPDFDVIVIGGGASGMMAAFTAAQNKKKVLIIEKNSKLGVKLGISGGGRCNITNEEQDPRAFLKFYGDKEQFLYSAFEKFSNKDTFTFFNSKKMPLVVEARKRAFPHTQSAESVRLLMESLLKQENVVIKLSESVKKIHADELRITKIETTKGIYTAKNYIIATGGKSHPETGSTGDGFKWLKDLGHTVAEPTPSIVPLKIKDNWVHTLSGTSLSFMKITFYVDDIKKFNKKGKVLFTHFGLSGPLILNSSKAVSDLMHEGLVTAKIDMYPDTDIGALDKKITAVFDEHKNKMFKNVVDLCVPEGIAKGILIISPIDNNKKVHSITKEERRKFVDLLKAMPMEVEGLMGFDRAVIADGGVPLEEMNMRTMGSLKKENMFITGDLLHVNRPSGGFSLQLCWTTGYVAGKHV